MNCNNNLKCGCDFNIKTVGNCDVSKLNINGSNKANLNWTEISIPEILCIPPQKPDIEAIDQVFANIILENTKLIETPFAYKKYVLFSFYTAVTDLEAALPGLLTGLTGSVTALVVPLNTTLLTTLNTLETALGLLAAVPGVPALIGVVTDFETVITNLVIDINNATSAVTTAVNNLLSTIATAPFSADLICAAITTLIDTLNALTTLINSIIGILTTFVTALGTAATAIGDIAVTAAVDIAVTAINLLINTTLPPLIDTVNTSILDILNSLIPVDCDNAYAFTLIGNAEGTCLSGRKLIIEGTLNQKVVYTAEVTSQSVHSAHYTIPFIAFIIPYAKFEGLTYEENIQVYDPITDGPIFINGYIYGAGDDITVDLCEEFNVDTCIEDIYVHALSKRKIFKNVTVFLKATIKTACN